MEDPKKEPRRYFGFHFKALRILGLGRFHHPDENNFDNYPTVFDLTYVVLCTAINVIGYTVSETLYAYKVWKEGREASVLFFAYTMVGIDFFAGIKCLILIKNNKRIQRIVRVLEVDSKYYNGDPKILEQSMFATKVITWCFFIIGEVTITLMTIFYLTVDIDRKRRLRESNYTIEIPRDTPFAVYVPWDTSDDLPFAAGFIYCVFGTYWMGSTLIICDTMIASIMVHITGQFKMIQKVVENIGENALDTLLLKLDDTKRKRLLKYSELTAKKSTQTVYELIHPDGDFWDKDEFAEKKKHLMSFFTEDDLHSAMVHCLSEAIQYHQLIIDITEELQDAYSQAFLCQILQSFYVIGLILVQTAQDVSNVYSLRFINTLGFLISILWQLFMQTYSANEITLEAEKVSDSAFSSRWYSAGYGKGKVGRLLLVLMQRSNRPLHLTAGKLAPMGNQLFVTVIRNAYQIFTLITTAMSGEK